MSVPESTISDNTVWKLLFGMAYKAVTYTRVIPWETNIHHWSEHMSIVLHATAGAWGLPSISPPCVELDTWLRMANVEYVRAPQLDIQIAPKGKIPFIEYKGRYIGDAMLITDMLSADLGIDLNDGLSPGERAISHALRRMLKENTYWGVVEVRFCLDENWTEYRKVLGNALIPGGSEEQWGPIAEAIRGGNRDYMRAHGIGRHSHEEIAQIITADCQAVSDFLGDKAFLMGERPTAVDATAFAHIASLLIPPYGGQLVEAVAKMTNLRAYCDRMRERYFA